MKWLRWLLSTATLFLVACAIHWWPHVRNEFFVLVGSRNESGGWYGFHSGFGGAAYITLPFVGAAFWWHHQCGVHGCYWYARRKTAAGEPACFLHHPDPRRSVADLHKAHHAALALLHHKPTAGGQVTETRP